MVDKVTETKGMNFQINDPIQKAYDKMLGVEDVIEQSQQEEQEIKESVKEINDLPDIAQLDENESVNEAISVADEKIFNKGKGIIIVIDDNGEKVSAIFKNKKNADKFNRNKPSDVKKLLKLAKSKKYLQAIDENESITKSDVIEESKEVYDDIIISEDGKEFIIDEKKFTITQGVANAFRKPELAYGKIMVKKICSKCNFHMPAFTGRYPSNCPLCGTPFAQSEKVKYSLNTEGRCIAVLEELKEGKFKEISQEIDVTVDDIVQQIKDRKVKNNRDLNNLLKKMKSGKDLPSGVQTSTVKNNFSKIVTGISAKIKKDKVKF
jgi:hypothetical protein